MNPLEWHKLFGHSFRFHRRILAPLSRRRGLGKGTAFEWQLKVIQARPEGKNPQNQLLQLCVLRLSLLQDRDVRVGVFPERRRANRTMLHDRLLLMPVVVVYLGLITMFVGGASVLVPFKVLGIRARWQALVVMAAGLVVVIIGCSLPAKVTRVTVTRTRLDEFMPAWQFNESHSIRIAGPKEKVYTALKQVTAEEILFFRTLVWIRRLGQSGPESILNPPPNTPLLDVATRTTFIPLAEEPNREFLVGTLVAAPRGWHPSEAPTPEGFKSIFQHSGFAPAAMNFQLEDCSARTSSTTSSSASVTASAAPCTLLTTETRVYATDTRTRRAFARYWRVIYPGSSLIRSMWLRAVKKRLEKG